MVFRALPEVKTRRVSAALAMVAAVSAVEVFARPALGEEGPRTGRTEELVRSRIARGAEAWMPRDGAYARAIAAVVDGKWRLAAQQFLAAAAEMRKRGEASLPCPPDDDRCAGRDSDLTRARLRLLLRKIAIAASEAQTLSDAGPLPPAPGAPPAKAFEPSFEERLREVIAAHDLYLAARAFHGRDQPAMRARIEHTYRDALGRIAVTDRSPIHARLRLGLASLLADGGDRVGAASEFARVPLSDRSPENVDLIAHYHAAMGDPQAAFDALFAARDALADWGEVAAVFRVSNDLDELRDDPRLEALLGKD